MPPLKKHTRQQETHTLCLCTALKYSTDINRHLLCVSGVFCEPYCSLLSSADFFNPLNYSETHRLHERLHAADHWKRLPANILTSLHMESERRLARGPSSSTLQALQGDGSAARYRHYRPRCTSLRRLHSNRRGGRDLPRTLG